MNPRKIDTTRARRLLPWRFAMLSVAVILFAAATAYGFYKLRQESHLAQYNSQAAFWLVVSFEREYLKFHTMMSQYAGTEHQHADELLTQFDVLWSRIVLINEGGHSPPLRRADSFLQAVPVAAELLHRYDAAIFAALPAGQPFPADFVTEYRALADPIHQFMVDVHINRGWSDSVRQAHIKDIRLALYITLGGTLLSTLMLFAIIVVQLKTRHGNLVRTRAVLAQSEKDRDALSREIERRMNVEKERKQLMADLEARNEELERYAYTISHDLKSPLYTIQGFTGFLERDLQQGRTDKMLDDLSKVKNAVQTMGRLLDDILSLSKVNLAAESMHSVDLNQIVKEAITLVSREINEQGVIVSVESSLPTVYGEPHRLTEVFQNLVSNAVKFMGEQKHPRVEITALVGNAWARCRVADNGIGIEPEYQERVFNLFERLETSTQGTGIGLAIVKRIVERHGGVIEIKSDGKSAGTCFEFTLPLSAEARAGTAT